MGTIPDLTRLAAANNVSNMVLGNYTLMFIAGLLAGIGAAFLTRVIPDVRRVLAQLRDRIRR